MAFFNCGGNLVPISRGEVFRVAGDETASEAVSFREAVYFLEVPSHDAGTNSDSLSDVTQHPTADAGTQTTANAATTQTTASGKASKGGYGGYGGKAGKGPSSAAGQETIMPPALIRRRWGQQSRQTVVRVPAPLAPTQGST